MLIILVNGASSYQMLFYANKYTGECVYVAWKNIIIFFCCL